jgi:hypothetical protein
VPHVVFWLQKCPSKKKTQNPALFALFFVSIENRTDFAPRYRDLQHEIEESTVTTDMHDVVLTTDKLHCVCHVALAPKPHSSVFAATADAAHASPSGASSWPQGAVAHAPPPLSARRGAINTWDTRSSLGMECRRNGQLQKKNGVCVLLCFISTNAIGINKFPRVVSPHSVSSIEAVLFMSPRRVHDTLSHSNMSSFVSCWWQTTTAVGQATCWPWSC